MTSQPMRVEVELEEIPLVRSGDFQAAFVELKAEISFHSFSDWYISAIRMVQYRAGEVSTYRHVSRDDMQLWAKLANEIERHEDKIHEAMEAEYEMEGLD